MVLLVSEYARQPTASDPHAFLLAAFRHLLHIQHEADTRYGAFDFRAAYEEAPDDLRELLDSHER